MRRKLTAKLLIKALQKLKTRYLPREEFLKKWNKIRRLLYETGEYQAFLIEVRVRANYMCEEGCGKKGREVHHVIPVYKDPSLAVDVKNGKFLCSRCHKKQHRKPPKKDKEYVR